LGEILKSLSLFFIATISLTVTLGIGAATTSANESQTPSITIENNAETSLVADKIFEMSKDEGFSGQVIDEDLRTIHLTWVGQLPLEIQEYIDSIPHGVTIYVNTKGKITRKQGQAAISRIVESDQARVFGVVSASVHSDGAGITVSLEGEPSDLKYTIEKLSEISGLQRSEIYLKTNEAPIVSLATRVNDESP
jgi:hypothetical protein